MHRYRAIRILDRPGRARDSLLQVIHREIRTADICKACACSCVWGLHQGRNNTPSRPRRDCPDSRSAQRSALSKWCRGHSITPARNKSSGDGRRCRRCRLPPSDTLGSERGRVEKIPRPCRRDCNPRGRFPTAARRDRAPSASNAFFACALLRAGGLRWSGFVACLDGPRPKVSGYGRIFPGLQQR